MHSTTRTLIVVIYLVLAGIGIAYAQSQFLAEAEAYGKLLMLGISILGVVIGAAGAWFGLGYRVKSNADKIGEVCEWQERHDELHRAQNGEFREKLDRILDQLTGGQ